MKPKFQKSSKAKSAVNPVGTDPHAAKLAEGFAFHKEGKLDQAEIIYRNILEINANHFDAIQLLGTIALQKNEYEKAIATLSLAVKIEANNFSVLTNLGNAFKGVGRFEESIACYDKVLTIKKDFQDAYLNRGIALHHLCKFDDAIASFRKALKNNASFAEAHYSLGLTLKELKKHEDALSSLDAAILINPNLHHAFNIKGVILLDINRIDDALICFEKAIAINPNFYEAHSNRGNVLRQLKRLEEALISYDRAIEIRKDSPVVYSNRGTALRELLRYESALENYERAIKLDPNYADAYFNQGLVLHELKKYDAALESLVKAINLNPHYSDAYTAVGSALHDIGQFNEALKSYELAINLNSDSHAAYLNQALAFHELRRFNEALQNYERTINLKSDSHEAYFNRGNTYQKVGQLTLAIEEFEKAISLKPDYASAFLNRGLVYCEMKQIDRGLESFEKAYQFDSNLEYLIGVKTYHEMMICDWTNLEHALLFCESEIQKHKKVLSPFDSLVLLDNPHLHSLVTQIYLDSKIHKYDPLGKIVKRKDDGKLRIGYYSADLYYHPASIWLAEQLENHDKSRFELYAFSLKLVNDPMQARLQMAFDHWIDVRGMSDIEVAQLSRDLKIDIAIDLNGFTQDSRTNIFAARAAPIQVNNIGYPGSTGTDFIDYFLADPHAVSQENRKYFTEKIAFVPCNYTYDSHRQVSKEPVYRSQYGLPENGFVFTCQNGCHKFNPEVFSIWMEILNSVSGSVLWLLKPSNEIAIKNLKKEARQRGIDDDRLVFTGREVVPIEQENQRVSRYLASYKLADLFLDTWPYNAGTTAIDALMAGTPVLTKVGYAVSARMCYSALKQIDVPELITYSAQEYKDLAISLAKEPQNLKLVKDKVQRNRLTTPLFDPIGNTRHIENAYLEMYRRYQEDLPLDDINL